MKSGKSTVSFTYLGKSYRFFEEIRRVKIGCADPNFVSLKTTSSLSETAQTWREKPANSSDMVRFSGKLFRHDNKTRLLRCVGAGLTFKELRLKKWCKAISLLPSSLHYATSLQALKSLSITCKRWLMVSCVHDPFFGTSSKRRERLSMKCVATNHSSF